MPIQYITGDATQPIGEGNKIIAHVCNDVGRWGKGFVLAISKRWPHIQRGGRLVDVIQQGLHRGGTRAIGQRIFNVFHRQFFVVFLSP